MADFYTKLTGTIDRRSPDGEGKPEDPVIRENWLARDGVLKIPGGTEDAISSVLTDKCTWLKRYYTGEIGVESPKTFGYTQDGKIVLIDENSRTHTESKDLLNTKDFPKSVTVNSGEQNVEYFVDGKALYKYDGNNDNKWEKVALVDSDGNDVNPVGIEEHLDRLWVISKRFLFVSANLDFDNFSSATDSLQIVVGTGKEKNFAIGKLRDRLYILTTGGIRVVAGDFISALAPTFEIELADERRIIAGGSLAKVENALVFVADDYEVYSWNGSFTKQLSYNERLKDFMGTKRDQLDQMTATYENNYYKLSFVEKGETYNKREWWWDSLEEKSDFVVGRNVSAYMQTDSTKEEEYFLIGTSEGKMVAYANRGFHFRGSTIVPKVRSRDLTPKKGKNMRFTAFYPDIDPTGDRDLQIAYLLDGRLSKSDTVDVSGSQNLRGEVKTLGFIKIKNQSQFTDRFRPKINYARGESISFEITMNEYEAQPRLIGIGIDFVQKSKSKGKKVGQ